MVGNDLVYLQKAAAESNWKRKGFLEKLCSRDEQQLIWEAKDSFLLFWIMWTMKESVYKIINRQTGIRNYAPAALQCKNIQLNPEGARGTVNYQGQSFSTLTTVQHNLVHSIAVLAAAEFAKVKVLQLNYHKNYMEDFNQSSTSYQIDKKDGLPEMTNRLSGLKHAISISHHGPHLAIAYSDSPLLTN